MLELFLMFITTRHNRLTYLFREIALCRRVFLLHVHVALEGTTDLCLFMRVDVRGIIE